MLIPFEYAVIQFHRNPVRGEPFNIGLLMAAPDASWVRFENNIKSALKLGPTELRMVVACLEQIRHNVQAAGGQVPLAERVSGLSAGSIQLTEVRGGITEDLEREALGLFDTFVLHSAPVRRPRRGPETGIAKEVKTILKDHQLYGQRRISKNYAIGVNEAEQIKLDFGCRSGGGHIAIEAVDLTAPERETRLERVGVAAGKFQFLHDRVQNVRRYTAVKTNGVDVGWELRHITESSDRVFDIQAQAQVPAFVDEIRQAMAAGR